MSDSSLTLFTILKTMLKMNQVGNKKELSSILLFFYFLVEKQFWDIFEIVELKKMVFYFY